MAFNALDFPVDVQWRLLATSQDMFASSIDASFPAKWKSSLAVYFFEPEADPDSGLDDPTLKTVFLKVVATITGYVYDGPEIDPMSFAGDYRLTVYKNFTDLTALYFPALAALVQVGIFPKGTQADGTPWPLSQYPWFTDFEPKKREVIELASDTGEVLTQSATNMSVRKGVTGTDSQENVNIDHGFSFSQAGQAAGFGGTTAGDIRRDVGSRGVLGTSTENVVTTDSSREKRESSSHTTNLTQQYSTLDSYHSGTNRALFFLNARPHFVDSPLTFVNGPRRLEGIQEFFLISQRPAAMEGFCVKATLETAHVFEHDETVDIPGTGIKPDKGHITQTFSKTGRAWQAGDPAVFGTVYDIAPITGRITIPDGYQLDASSGGGPKHVEYAGDSRDLVLPGGVDFVIDNLFTHKPEWSDAIPQLAPSTNFVDVLATIRSWYDLAWDNSIATETFTVTVFTITTAPATPPEKKTVSHADLFITSRDVQGCVDRNGIASSSSPSYVSYETALSTNIVQGLRVARLETGRVAVIAANAVTRAIKEAVVQSFRSGSRYAPQEVDFLHTDFAYRSIFGKADASFENDFRKPLAESKAIPENLRTLVLQQMKHVTVANALSQSPGKIAATLKIPVLQARQLMAEVAGVRFAPQRREH